MGVKFIFNGVKSAYRQVCNLLLIGSHTYGMRGFACATIFYRAVIPNGIFCAEKRMFETAFGVCTDYQRKKCKKHLSIIGEKCIFAAIFFGEKCILFH
jgi:hypothetical protein